MSRPFRGHRALRVFALAVAVAMIVPQIRPSVVSAACGELTKFVEQGTGSSLYYGNRDAIFTYKDLPSCSGAVNAQSTFLRTRDDYLSWVEAGVRLDDSGVAHYWTEWRSYPGGAPPLTYDSQGHPGIGAYYSFKITYVGSPGFFGIYRASGSNPNTASWQFLAIADQMIRNTGQAESEEAHIGSGDSMFTTASTLQTQASVGGSWTLWTNLECDQSQNNMPGWYAHKLSNSSWATNQNSPGLC